MSKPDWSAQAWADMDGLANNGWLYVVITLFMIVPVVLLSIAISKLPSPRSE